MAEILDLYNNLIANYGVSVFALCVAVLVLLFVQLYYYVGLFGRIPSFRLNSKAENSNPPVSVVVVVNEDEFFIEQLLPAILTQDYPNFELVIVDLEHNDDFSQSLQLIAENNERVKLTTVHQKGAKFKVSNKMAINIGIKAASFENIIITTVDSLPTSNKWLRIMAQGFLSADVVIGYCGVEQKEGFANKWIRCDKLFKGVQYLAAAIAGRVYRADIHNMGFTKTAYFGASGFNFLSFNLGEDDLFIQKLIRNKNRATIVLNPNAIIRQQQWSGLSWWASLRRFNSSSFKFYPLSVKNYIQGELVSRILFFACCATIFFCLPLAFKIFALVVFVIRFFVVWFEFMRIRKRLGEKSLGLIYVIYDIISIFTEIKLWFSRFVKPSQGLWR